MTGDLILIQSDFEIFCLLLPIVEINLHRLTVISRLRFLDAIWAAI